MASLKERIEQAVSAYEKTRKGEKAAEAVAKYNRTISELAKNAREIKNQKSS